MSDLEDLDLPEYEDDENEDLEFSDLDLDELENNQAKESPLIIEKQPIVTITNEPVLLEDDDEDFLLSDDNEESAVEEVTKDDISPQNDEKSEIVNTLKLDNYAESLLPKATMIQKDLNSIDTPRSTRSATSEGMESIRSSKPSLESTSCQTDWSIPSYITFDVEFHHS